MGRPRDSSAKAAVLRRLKARGPQCASELAARLGISRQAARQHLLDLEKYGSVFPVPAARAPRAGRPERRYALTEAAENLFPKSYDVLAAELIGALVQRLGKRALKDVLSSMADERVRQWEPRLAGKSLVQRLELLKEIYSTSDAFMSVERKEGEVRLIERNCPFYNVARRQPALCSLTVSVLSRLLGRRVQREERFQNGHGRCVFRVDKTVKPSKGFEFETD